MITFGRTDKLKARIAELELKAGSDDKWNTEAHKVLRRALGVSKEQYATLKQGAAK